MIALWSGTTVLVMSSVWLSVKFMIDPRSVAWMNQFLPENAKIPVMGWDDPKTMTEINRDLKKEGLIAGDPISIKSVKGTTDIILPIVRRTEDFDRLVELRVYRRILNPMPNRPEAFQFINQLDIRELNEAFVTEPLVRARAANPPSDRTLPFTTIQRLPNSPANGIWLTLTGKQPQGDTSIAYGQVVYYNPTTTALSMMLPWTSPADELPTWQKLPKGRPAELVVNHTVGLEPEFEVYQLRSSRQSKAVPFQLQQVSLTQSAIDDGAFIDALFLARTGLWSPALEIMQSVKRQLPSADWTQAAQVQMEVVARHAKVTKTQADQPWASSNQQVLANLLDGRWARATQLLQNSPADRFEVLDLLKFDPGRIQKRITAALKLNPARSDVQTWAALRMTAKQGKAQAIAWLNKQPRESSVLRAQTVKLLNQLDGTELGNALPETFNFTEKQN